MCDEIFGQENVSFANRHLEEKVGRHKATSKSASNDDHEYILMVARQKEIWTPEPPTLNGRGPCPLKLQLSITKLRSPMEIQRPTMLKTVLGAIQITRNIKSRLDVPIRRAGRQKVWAVIHNDPDHQGSKVALKGTGNWSAKSGTMNWCLIGHSVYTKNYERWHDGA